MGDTIRWGIVGTGMMGIEHIANLKLTPGAEIVALADPFGPSLDRAAAAVGAPVARYDGAAALARHGGLDAVLIASPNFTHRAVLKPLMAAGVHILCEKPLCTTLADARFVADIAQGYDRVFWTGMEYRYMPPAAEFIDRVQIGRAHV